MSPEQFIAQKLPLQPLSLWPDIVLHQANAHSGLAAWLEAYGHRAAPYWAYAWAGGAALALHLKAHPELVAGKTVLDLGSGSGLVGIAAAKLGAAAVFALDPDPLAQVATTLNAEANGVALTLVPTLLHTDIVVAGDVFYDEDSAAAVLPLLQALAQTGTQVLIGDPYRSTRPADAMREIARYSVPDMGAKSPVPSGIFALIERH
ncbi:methyltransferase [Devosia sp. MC532]|uniref:class I SAM-dependent methyltransferase n=1 Tax=Devosia sp. MC532 TaxID=2799788 RepID=UPI0018F67DFD|nr:50S ribosomal protein L11 methyltransferase [Devosia sp. MC532]MBJ7578643.1 methyltransferase [Devosia sp. MC532]